MREKEAAQDAIWNESMHFWKTAIILVALLFGIWFFLAHTLPGGGRLMGRSCENVSSFGTTVEVHIAFAYLHIVAKCKIYILI